jgi:hypothetical protein
MAPAFPFSQHSAEKHMPELSSVRSKVGRLIHHELRGAKRLLETLPPAVARGSRKRPTRARGWV